MKLLIVEDDPGLARLLRRAAVEAGYSAEVVGDGHQAVARATERDFDLMLLDIMLPGIDGFEVCRRVRASGVAAPILIVTARDAVGDKVAGLDAGADDYVVKPFQVAELLARIRALLRRRPTMPAAAGSNLVVADLTLDTASREARRGERRLHFSATEYALLEYLMRNSGRVLTRLMILEHVWEYDFAGNDNVLDVYIGYLRGKIDRGRDTALIHTVRGVGFVIEDRGPTVGKRRA